VNAAVRVLARGLLHLARTGQLRRSPRSASLALVDWYRATVSAGRQCCPTGRDGTRASCSRYGRRVIARYGALVGWWLVLARMRQCAVLAMGNQDAGDCFFGVLEGLTCGLCKE
jgi:putative component of membrane protein insertase Oxa1/YidC/SpoIIIJ protein YidD